MRLLRSLAVLAAALPLTVLPTASGHAAPPSPATHLALGDSVAVGTGATVPAAGGYAALLAAELQGKGCGKGKAVGCRVELVNLAVDGATTVTLIERQLEAAVRLIDERNATPTSVDDVRLITITIGGNDLLGPVTDACASGLTPTCLQTIATQLSPQTIATQLALVSTNSASILSQLRAAAGPDTTIAVSTYYNAVRNPGCPLVALSARSGVVLEAVNAVIRQQAAAYGAVVVETAPVVDPVTESQPDCLHPNDAGHRDIAGAFADAIGNPFKGRGR